MALKIYNWKATRSGASLTIVGEDEEGRPCRRTKVTSIETHGTETIAFGNMGTKTLLVAGTAK